MGTLLSSPSFYQHLGHTKRGVTMTFFVLFFPASGFLETPKGARWSTNKIWRCRLLSMKDVARYCDPRGPKDWKNSRFRSGIEIFKRPISAWNFQSRLKFSSEPHNKAPLCGELSMSGLKFSIESENFKPGLKISSVWIENFTRSIGIEFFQSQGPLGYHRCSSSSDAPYCAILFHGRLALPQMVRYRPLVLNSTQTHLCDTPFCNVSRDNCATPP